MKKVVSILLVLALVLCSAVAMAEAASEKDFIITLTGNPTTGYEWKYVAGPEDVVTVGEEYLTSADIDKLAGIEPSAEMLSGEGGLYVYTLKGVKPGKAVLAFEYAQSWDETSTVAGLTYAITVNDDLSVVCTASTLGL